MSTLATASFHGLARTGTMSAKIASAEDDEVHDLESGHKQISTAVKTITDPSMLAFRDHLGELCKVLNEMNDKMSGSEKDIKIESKRETLWERISDNNLKDMFIGRALILTIPYGIMASTGYDYWDWVENTLAACETTEFSYKQDFTLFRIAFSGVVYCTISVLLMAMAYYLLRPKTDAKFRRWWKYARYVILMMLLGTVISCVGLVGITSWLFSWYMIPTSRFCTYSGQGGNIVGIIFIGLSFVMACFLML
jgi:hypothetical protein